MSLITRCPACETLFKVVPDQLRVSEGWVRCGQCEEIFDASLHLLQTGPEGRLPADQADQADQADERTESHEGANVHGDGPLALDVELASGQSTMPCDHPIDPAQVLPAAANDDAAHSAADPVPDEFAANDPATPELVGWQDAQADRPSVPPLVFPSPATPGDSDSNDSGWASSFGEVSFLRGRQKKVFRHKPFMRATLLLLSMTLLLGLLGQVVFHERDRMVALAPALKPWLQGFCGPLNCTLSALRRIESIAIDTSSFVKVRGDVYQLSFTLKNTAPTALAAPAIELTLTDAVDRPVMRRVFLLNELGAQSDTLAADSEWHTAVPMAVKAGGSGGTIVGYRLLTFYP